MLVAAILVYRDSSDHYSIDSLRIAINSVKVPGTELPIYYEHLNVDIEVFAGKGRAKRNVKMRELIGMVGVERFGVKVTELADVLGKSRDGVSCWMRRGVERRATDPSFAAAAERLEYVASEEP